MSRRGDRPMLDEAAVAAVVEGLCERGATRRAYIPAEGTTVCVEAVNAGRDASTSYSEAASRRAAVGGRRMLPVVGTGKLDDRFWIAYETDSMSSLPEFRDRRPLSTATSVRVLSDAARALDEAAAAGVFAWELAPDSVFVTGKGARLGDLGTAREALAGASFDGKRDPAYVPPEVLAGNGAGERSGVYLFGALLHYVLTGSAPSREGGRADLPASIRTIVEATMADDPERRPETASEANEMARRALRGEPPARARRRRGGKARSARPEAPARKRRGRKAEPASANAAARKRRGRKPALAGAAVATRGRLAATARLLKSRAISHRPRKPSIALPRPTVAPALAVGGALALGGAAGLVLDTSPPEPARPETVTASGFSVTLPSGRHRVETRGKGLAVRGPGSVLRARVVHSPRPPRPGARPVRLGAHQAWRHAGGKVVRYSVPTSAGTLAITCRRTAPAGSRPLRLCERTASTLSFRHGRRLPLAAVAEDSRRLRTAIAGLAAERKAGRATLGSASTPEDQRLAAEKLAASHERAAAALRELSGSGRVEAAVRATADAYSRLAAAAENASPERWAQASERVRRSDAALAGAIAAGVG